MLFPARAVLASGAVFAPLLLLFGAGLYTAPPFFFGAAVLAAGTAAVAVAVVHCLGCCAGGAGRCAARHDAGGGFALSIGIFSRQCCFPCICFLPTGAGCCGLNPMTAWVSGYQAVLLQGAWPTWPVWVACVVWLAFRAAFARDGAAPQPRSAGRLAVNRYRHN